MKTIKEFSAEVLSTKTGLLEQIDDCINILLSPIDNYEKRMMLKAAALKDEIRPFEDEFAHLLTEKGYQTENGGITLFYGESGKIQFRLDYLAIVYNIVKDKFPNSAVLPKNKTKTYAQCRSLNENERMSIRTSFEETQVAYDFAKHNYEEANKSGNKKLIELFTENAKVEIECMKIAKRTDYARIANEKEYRANECFFRWQNEFNKNSEKYYSLGFSPITVDGYVLLLEKDMLDVTYAEAAVIVLFFEQLKVGKCAGINDYIAKNTSNIINADMALRTTYGRKDGNGFIQPKNNNDQFRFTNMQNTLAKYKFIKDTLDAIFNESKQKAAV